MIDNNHINTSTWSASVKAGICAVLVLSAVGVLGYFMLRDVGSGITVQDVNTAPGGSMVIASSYGIAGAIPSKVLVRYGDGNLKTFACGSEDAKVLCTQEVGTDLCKLGTLRKASAVSDTVTTTIAGAKNVKH